MEAPVLKDENQFPTEEVVYACLGKNRKLWDLFFEGIRMRHPDFSPEWRYYRDGKSWLMKVTRKKKTIFWLSLAEGTFRTTFYFGDQAERPILESCLAEERKQEFANGKRYNRIRGITILHRARKDREDAWLLVELKEQMK